MNPREMPEDLPTSTDATSAGGEDPNTAAHIKISKLGRYTITRLIGEGGMGAVYEAEQDQPRRTVALKVIKPGLASPELLRRFAQESQALGRLQHPGIAQIYDAGTADAGYGPQPYFAMEFIRGETLRDYADSHKLTARQRLEIVAKVCDAVHHAHQRGLIHRDLKPGNILVDDTGQPKILDFGVARVTDSDAQATMQTDVGQLVGTLAYMSPEQVLADPLELDIRSDVYALGVILYELLAGRLPYTISRKIHEALHAISEEDPAKLSSINRTYRGDIETIAAKALEKDKNRRYASAAELAADIRHYLSDEPIVARPPSTSYQLKKFASRHRALVTGLASVMIVLAIGIVVAVSLAIRAKKAETAAEADRDRATKAEQVATVARDQAVQAQNQAVESEGHAKSQRDKAVAEKQRADTEAETAKAVSKFLQKNMFEQVAGQGQSGASSNVSVTSALDRAAARIDGTFDKQPLVEAGVREAVADAYAGLALYDKATAQFERALALRRRAQSEDDVAVLNAMRSLASMYALQRRSAEAESLFQRVVTLQEHKQGSDPLEMLKYRLELAAVYAADGKFEKAELLAQDVLAARKRQLGPGDKDTVTVMILLVTAYRSNKKSQQAAALAKDAYEISRRSLGENDILTVNAKTLPSA
jgi:non-specific serine/threonine protein kinase/serine/threonine-protein kinase